MDDWFVSLVFGSLLVIGVLYLKKYNTQQESFQDTAPIRSNCNCPGPKVTLWQHCHKTGWKKELCLGEVDAVNNNDFPTDASYISVPKGYRATLFKDGIGKGGLSKVVKGGSDFDFCSEGWWANDSIRAIRVENEGGGYECDPTVVTARTLSPASVEIPSPAPPPPPPPPPMLGEMDTVNLFEFGRHRSFMVRPLDNFARKQESGLFQKNVDF